MRSWYIAWKDLKILFKDRGAIIMLFLVPLVVMTIAGFALSGQYRSGPRGIRVPFVDLDRSDISRQLEAGLTETRALILEDSLTEGGPAREMTEKEARQIIEIGERSAAIVIPEGFGKKVQTGQSTELIILRDPGSQVTQNVVRGILEGFASKISSASIAVQVATEEVMKATNGRASPGKIAMSALERARGLLTEAPVSVRSEDVQKVAGSEIDPFKQTVPGFAVMFALFIMLSGGNSFLDEKRLGTYRRLLTAPIRRSEILAGKLVPYFITVIVQMVFFFAVGHFVFHMELGNSIAGLLIMSTAVALAGTSMGILMASIVKTEAQLSSISVLIILAMSSLGGSWWPLDIVPGFMRTLAHVVTINAWALDGFKDLLWYGKGVVDILPEAGVLVAIAAAALGIGVWRFRFD
ncbi:MAG: ABC transporter permease [Candidatus Eisenbacteria bacterium]|nr:ABC transporter permease [Candidatus Eisenbacteria bacterium]